MRLPNGNRNDAQCRRVARTELAGKPLSALVETKRLLNAALQSAIGNLLDSAIVTETQSFDEPAFRANLARMLDK